MKQQMWQMCSVSNIFPGECDSDMWSSPLFGRFLFGGNLSPRNSANDREDPRDCNPMFKRLPAEVVWESKCCFFPMFGFLISKVLQKKQWQRERVREIGDCADEEEKLGDAQVL